MARLEMPSPLQSLAAWIGLGAGWYQRPVVEYQREELRLPREKVGGRRASVHRRQATASRARRKGTRPEGPRGGCNPRQPGDDPALLGSVRSSV